MGISDRGINRNKSVTPPPRRVLVLPSYPQHPQPYHGRSVRAQLSRTPGSDTGTRRCRVEVRISPVHQGLRRIAVKHRYDMRHQCQEILPGLLLGPFQVSKNQVTLNELGISHMYASCSEFLHIVLSFVSLGCLVPRVCIRDVKEAFSVRPRFPEAFEYLVLDVQDSEEQNLIRLFPTFVS